MADHVAAFEPKGFKNLIADCAPIRRVEPRLFESPVGRHRHRGNLLRLLKESENLIDPLRLSMNGHECSLLFTRRDIL